MPDAVDEIAEALAARYPGRAPIGKELRAAIRLYLSTLEGRTIPREKADRLSRLWNGGSR